MKKIAVIDYGMGNLHSVAKAVEHVDGHVRVEVTASEDSILAADRVIFPGVGAMRDCMAEIRRLGIDDMLRRVVETTPVLAICVGMQALMEYSEENQGVDCIGLFPGRVRRFSGSLHDSSGVALKVPHMGWNNVAQTRAHALWQDIPDDSRFYFVHSYFVEPAKRDCVVGESAYPEAFAAAIADHNIFAVQFHPEKSQRHGLQLLKNFVHWDGGI
ncbi:MAG: imidazole glycerol phosphate synthase subunit HisH [Pseudomonadales bacterium]|nr:imidazole glycerol phosphate synthase subunit HisH [Pseudomonadales bacterium]